MNQEKMDQAWEIGYGFGVVMVSGAWALWPNINPIPCLVVGAFWFIWGLVDG